MSNIHEITTAHLRGCERAPQHAPLKSPADTDSNAVASLEVELVALRKRLAEVEAALSFCADHVTNIRATSDGYYEVRLIEENLLEALRGGHWYAGATLEAAIAAARSASDNESEATK